MNWPESEAMDSQNNTKMIKEQQERRSKSFPPTSSTMVNHIKTIFRNEISKCRAAKKTTE